MGKSTDLFDLIHSMSKSEKRYFKIEAGKHVIGDQNNYVELFDAIEKQKRYDEDTLLEKFSGKKFTNQLSTAKNYLYKLIMKSLRSFHDERTVSIQVNNMLREIEILYNRELFKQCYKIIIQAKELAYRIEDYGMLRQIINWEQRLTISEWYDKGDAESYFDKLAQEEELVISKLLNRNKYWKLYANLMVLTKGRNRNKSAMKKIRDEIKLPWLQDENLAFTFHSKHFLYSALGLHARMMNEPEKGYQVYKKHVALISEHMEQIGENPLYYITPYFSLIIRCIQLQKYDEAIRYIDKLNEVHAIKGLVLTDKLKTLLFVSTHVLRLVTYIYTGTFKEGVAFLEAQEKDLNQNVEKLNLEWFLSFNYNAAFLYFGIGEFSKALPYLNEVLNEQNVDFREDYQCESRIFNLILHYEKQNFDLLESQLKSTRRFLQRKNSLFSYYTTILEFLKNEVQAGHKTTDPKQFILLKERLRSDIENNPDMEIHFDMIRWAESHENNCSIETIFKRNYQHETEAA